MKTAAIIQARMGSSRFPGKTLAPLLGEPLLARLIERLRHVAAIDEIIVATTDDPADEAIEDLARTLGIGCYRGSVDDVLLRVLEAGRAYDVDLMVEICGDCPLIDPQTTRDVIALYHSGDYDHASNILCEGYPRGLDTQVYPTRVLEDVARRTDDPVDHEHVSLFIYEHPEIYRLARMETPAHLRAKQLRLTVDTPSDLAMVEAIYAALYPGNPAFGIDEVAAFLDSHPEVREINAHIQQKPVR